MLMRPRSHAGLLCSEMVMHSPLLSRSPSSWICADLAERVQSPGLLGEQDVGDELAGCLGAGRLEAGRPGFESWLPHFLPG